MFYQNGGSPDKAGTSYTTFEKQLSTYENNMILTANERLFMRFAIFAEPVIRRKKMT